MPATWDSALQAYDDGLGHIWRNEAEGWVSRPGGATTSTTAMAPRPASTTSLGTAGTGSSLLDSQAQRDYWAGTLQNTATGNQQQYNLGLAGIAQQGANSQNQYNLGMAGIGQQNAASQNSYNTAMAAYQQANQVAQQQYNRDVAQFGLQQAQFNYQQRQQDAENKLLSAQFGLSQDQFQLSQDQFNATQRTNVADRKQKITTDLADRSGPQDMFKYLHLLDGMSAPTPSGSVTIDPYKALEGLDVPSNIPRQAAPDFGSISQPYSGTMPAFQPGGQFPSYVAPPATMPQFVSPAQAGPINNPTIPQPVQQQAPAPTQPQQPAQQQPAAAMPPAAVPTTPAYGGMNGTVNGQTVNHTGYVPPTYDPGVEPDPSGYRWDSATQRWRNPRDNDNFIPGYAQGGTTSGAAIVGDKKGDTSAEIKNDPHTELVYSSINPETGTAETNVIPHEHLARMIDMSSGRSGGTVLGGHKMPQAMMAMLPRASTGGIFGQATTAFDNGSTPISQTMPPAQGSYGAELNSPTYTFNNYSPQTIGQTPFIQKLQGNMASRPYGGFGAQINNPRLGLSNFNPQFNLKTFNDLKPTEQIGANALYGDLGLNLDDFYAQAQRAAPSGSAMPAMRYGG